jgi:RNA polymerase sigma factor (sigma-70 family)
MVGFMVKGQLSHVLRYIRTVVYGPATRDLTDLSLLERFAAEHDEAAFEMLVERHGPMVQGVCRRVLGHVQDAEDAFQATFLVLARKAGRIRWHAEVGNWLYQVAYRTALRARVNRKRVRERQMVDPPEAAAREEALWDDVRLILDEELNRLPIIYRAPVVLHYLEGKSYAETAKVLGWAEGTVSGRLARARELLRGRLMRRGLPFSAGAFATAVSQGVAPAALPPALADTTAKAATLFAAGPAAASAGIVSAAAAALAEGVLQTMFVTNWKTVAVIALASSLLATGAGLFAYHALATPQTEPPVVQPSEPASEQASAAEEFGTFEKRMQEAKSLFIAYVREVTRKEGQETTRSYDAGTYHVTPGQNPVTMMQHFKPDKPCPGPWSVASGQHYYHPITRYGFFGWIGVERPVDFLRLPVADLKLVKPNADADPAGSKLLAYTFYVSDTTKTPANARHVTLWLDEKSLVPLQRTVRVGPELEVTERYYGFSRDGVPAPYKGEPAGFVVNGRLSTKIQDDWVATPWLVQGNQYRAEQETRVFFDRGVKVTLAPGTQFTLSEEREGLRRRGLRLTRGRLSAELPKYDDYYLLLGPVRLYGHPIRPLDDHRDDREVVITATPDRVVAEQGSVRCEGAAAEPSTATRAVEVRLLHEGVEYRLADGKLRGQKERTLPRPDRPK